MCQSSSEATDAYAVGELSQKVRGTSSLAIFETTSSLDEQRDCGRGRRSVNRNDSHISFKHRLFKSCGGVGSLESD